MACSGDPFICFASKETQPRDVQIVNLAESPDFASKTSTLLYKFGFLVIGDAVPQMLHIRGMSNGGTSLGMLTSTTFSACADASIVNRLYRVLLLAQRARKNLRGLASYLAFLEVSPHVRRCLCSSCCLPPARASSLISQKPLLLLPPPPACSRVRSVSRRLW